VSCDDRNACTADACSPTAGCLHLTVQCAPPGDPCQVAVCDALLGCGVAPAVDGTRCGDNDCQTAHVCIAGACTERPAPEGSACGAATTCRGPGTCAAGLCALPPTQVPVPRWSYTPPTDMNLMRVVVDTQGNTFALLGTNLVYQPDAGPPPEYPLWLWSFDRDGRPRFGVNLSAGTPGLENGVGLVIDPDADRLYLAARTYNFGTSVPHRVVVAQARNATTGALLWERDLHQGIAVTNSTSGEMWLDVPAIILLQGVVAFSLVEGESLHQSYVLGLSAPTGAEQWRVQRSGHLGAGATANGELWEGSAACWSSDFFVSHVTSTGVSSAREPFVGSLLAYDQDRALAWSNTTPGQVSWVSPGFVQSPVPLVPGHTLGWGDVARVDGPALTLVARDSRQLRWLDRYDAATGTWRWSAPLGAPTGAQVWLLRDAGTATSLSFSDGGTELVTHDATGAEAERCPYGQASGVAVTNGLYVTQQAGSIVVFDVPGREAATSGWTGPNGYAGTGRAR
jgi:hypothetical protein